MYLEQKILSIMGSRDGYNQMKLNTKVTAFDKELAVIIKALDSYYKKYTHDDLVLETFKLHLYEMSGTGIKASEYAVYDALLHNFTKKLDTSSAAGLIYQLKELDLSQDITNAIQKYDRGEEISVYEELRRCVVDYEGALRKLSGCKEITTSLEDIVHDMLTGLKFRFRLQGLGSAMPDMKTGDQIIFGARPGTGKTSFLLSNCVAWASVAPEGRPVVWFNNEGKGEKVRLTLHRAALEASTSEIIQLGWEACASALQSVGCGPDRFKIFDVHGLSVYDVEELLSRHTPSVVVFDMVDNIHGFNNETRTDLRLERLYQWAREMAVIHDFLSIPVSQTSNDAENLEYPAQGMLKDSKTGKQGACDALVTMGKTASFATETTRYFHIAKAWKGSAEPGADPSGRCEAIFDSDRCTFKQS